MHTAFLLTAGWNRRSLKYKRYDGPLQCKEGFVEALWGGHYMTSTILWTLWHYMTSTWIAHLYVGLCWEVRFHILESHPKWVVLSRIYMPHSNSVPIFISESTTPRPDQQCLLQSINSSARQIHNLGGNRTPREVTDLGPRLESTCELLDFTQFIGTLWGPVSIFAELG